MDKKPGILAALLTDAGKIFGENIDMPRPPSPPRLNRIIWKRMHNSSFDDTQNDADDPSLLQKRGDEPSKIPELDEVQTLLVSGLLYGYSLREGKWGTLLRHSVLWYHAKWKCRCLCGRPSCAHRVEQVCYLPTFARPR
jgi:hypothetical protein